MVNIKFTYTPADHYWIVNGDETRVYSSARAQYVSVDDQTYVAWLAGDGGRVPTRIVSEEELLDVLREQAPEVLPAEQKPIVDISDRQFFQILAIRQMITQAEALAAVKTGDIPAALQTVVDGISDADQKFDAEMLLSGAVTFQRQHPLVNGFGPAFGMTPSDIDNLWRDAAALG